MLVVLNLFQNDFVMKTHWIAPRMALGELSPRFWAFFYAFEGVRATKMSETCSHKFNTTSLCCLNGISQEIEIEAIFAPNGVGKNYPHCQNEVFGVPERLVYLGAILIKSTDLPSRTTLWDVINGQELYYPFNKNVFWERELFKLSPFDRMRSSICWFYRWMRDHEK